MTFRNVTEMLQYVKEVSLSTRYFVTDCIRDQGRGETIGSARTGGDERNVTG